MITSREISTVLGLAVPVAFEVNRLVPLGYACEGRVLSFVTHRKYLSLLAREGCAPSVVFVTEALLDALPKDILGVVVDDPLWAFYAVLSHQARSKVYPPSFISSSAEVHASTVIAPVGVYIGDDVIIEPRVVLMPGVHVGARSIIRAGAVLGVDGFEHKRTSRGILSVSHDGMVLLGEEVEVGPNSCVIKGFSFRDTVIGKGSKLDALVHFAHSAQCGSGCFIAANAMIAGSVSIGDNVWIGPSVAISSQVEIGDAAYLSLGSVVARNVGAGEKVSGNFAIAHDKFLKHIVGLARG